MGASYGPEEKNNRQCDNNKKSCQLDQSQLINNLGISGFRERL